MGTRKTSQHLYVPSRSTRWADLMQHKMSWFYVCVAQGTQDSDSPATSQVAHLKAESISQAPTAIGSTLTAAALPTTAGPSNTSIADLELITDEVAAGTDKTAGETTANPPPLLLVVLARMNLQPLPSFKSQMWQLLRPPPTCPLP